MKTAVDMHQDLHQKMDSSMMRMKMPFSLCFSLSVEVDVCAESYQCNISYVVAGDRHRVRHYRARRNLRVRAVSKAGSLRHSGSKRA